ncbi:hypothetical protein BDQ12DRAFT_599283 [Crucibulum laeve]|uniref:ATP-dependent RNA helicase PRP5/DDX46/KHDC4 KH domain-containing protein n=1 Tax=Crucibulum laeve TaxID=68775 RepID=A0A5C3M8H7_9AGAR|nr:hypothetical protein BDQ12DRAFT_599283 [Crucibulum laeve]
MDMHDNDFKHDIDINDVKNRYLLTKGLTQYLIYEETGASVYTKGVWYPDRTKANEKDPPLYIHISAHTKGVLQKAIDRISELIATDMGSLVDKVDKPGDSSTTSFRHTEYVSLSTESAGPVPTCSSDDYLDIFYNPIYSTEFLSRYVQNRVIHPNHECLREGNKDYKIDELLFAMLQNAPHQDGKRYVAVNLHIADKKGLDAVIDCAKVWMNYLFLPS